MDIRGTGTRSRARQASPTLRETGPAVDVPGQYFRYNESLTEPRGVRQTLTHPGNDPWRDTGQIMTRLITAGGKSDPRTRVDPAAMAKSIEQLERRIASLEAKFSELAGDTIEIRDLSDSEAKKEIRRLFKERHGQILYPSDVAAALRLDYEQVERLIAQLVEEGKIAEANE